jgi:hypothetical protein
VLYSTYGLGSGPLAVAALADAVGHHDGRPPWVDELVHGDDADALDESAA